MSNFIYPGPKRPNIAVLGAGAWGTTVADLLAKSGFCTVLWGKESSILNKIATCRENPRYLPSHTLSPKLRVSSSLRESLKAANVVVLAIPVQYMRVVIRKASRYIDPAATFVNLAKGIESRSFKRASEIVYAETSSKHVVAALSGPNIAKELANRIPSKAVIAASDVAYLPWLREIFTATYFEIQPSPDLVGVEIAGALKNIVAILAGVSDGLGYGANTKAAIISAGLSEIIEFGSFFGANQVTFNGLAGLGDLVATCTSPFSRNRLLGESLGKGKGLRASIMTLHGRVAEGVETTRAIYNLKQQIGMKMPLTDCVYQILHSPISAIHRLFTEMWERR